METLKLDVTHLFDTGVFERKAPTKSLLNGKIHEAMKAYQTLQNNITAGQVGFFELPDKRDRLKPMEALYSEYALKNYRHFILIGMGGSFLGAKMLIHSLADSSTSEIQFHFLDNSDPEMISDILSLPLQECLFYVVSKTGGTAETIAGLLAVIQAYGTDSEEWKKHFIFATDPKNGDLKSLATEHQIPCLEIPTNVGGRFSVLTPAGLFPALFAGIPLKELLAGALTIRQAVMAPRMDSNPIIQLGTLLYLHWEEFERSQTVFMPYSSKLQSLSDWLVQLWGESLGKKGRGLTPIGATGATDQHSQLQLFAQGPDDKVVGFILPKKYRKEIILKNPFSNLENFNRLNNISMEELIQAQAYGTIQSLSNQGRPSFSIEIPEISACSIGQLIFFFETLTAFTGYLFSIDPFNQPGVEEGKKLTFQKLKRS